MTHSKSNIVLIPGYGTAVKRSIFKPAISKLRGFKIFDKTNSHVFEWGEEHNYTFLEALNLWEAIKLYKREKKMVSSKELQESLLNLLELNKPEVVVAHSLGTVLLTQVLKENSAKFIKKIVFVQSDLGIKSAELELFSHLKQQGVKLINVHCFWDQALISSMVLNHSIPLGLRPDTLFENHFIPLWRTLNLHESSLSDPKLLHLAK